MNVGSNQQMTAAGPSNSTKPSPAKRSPPPTSTPGPFTRSPALPMSWMSPSTTLADVPFETIAACTSDPFAGRPVATGRRKAIDNGYLATPNIRRPQGIFGRATTPTSASASDHNHFQTKRGTRPETTNTSSATTSQCDQARMVDTDPFQRIPQGKADNSGNQPPVNCTISSFMMPAWPHRNDTTEPARACTPTALRIIEPPVAPAPASQPIRRRIHFAPSCSMKLQGVRGTKSLAVPRSGSPQNLPFRTCA